MAKSPKSAISLSELGRILKERSWTLSNGHKMRAAMKGGSVQAIEFDRTLMQLTVSLRGQPEMKLETSYAIDIELIPEKNTLRIMSVLRIRKVPTKTLILELQTSEPIGPKPSLQSPELTRASNGHASHEALLHAFIQRMKPICVGRRIEDIEVDEDGITICVEGEGAFIFDFDRQGPTPKLTVTVSDESVEESHEIL